MSLLTPSIGLIFWMTIIFLIALFILGKWGWPVLIKSLNKREESIRQSLNAAKEAQQKMEELQISNNELILEAKKERELILKEAKQIKEKMIEDAKTDAKQQAALISQQALEQIEFEKNKALDEIKQQISELSLAIAEKILQNEVKDKETTQEIISKQLKDINL